MYSEKYFDCLYFYACMYWYMYLNFWDHFRLYIYICISSCLFRFFVQIFNINFNIDVHICHSISYYSFSFNQQWVIDIKVDPRNKQMLALTYDGIYVVSFIVSTCIFYYILLMLIHKIVISADVQFTHTSSYLEIN